MQSRPRSLPIVLATNEIDWAHSRALQRLAKRCRVADPDHRGLIQLAATLAHYAVDSCLPPGGRALPHESLLEIKRWSASPFALNARALRAKLLAATQEMEQATATAISHMLASAPREPEASLAHHAERVLIRHARRATHYAVGAVVLTLDTLAEPRQALLVPDQVAGALAYRATAFAGARNETLQREAQTTASELCEAGDDSHEPRALALQLFHEFLGARWQQQRDAHFTELCGFVDWALQPSQEFSQKNPPLAPSRPVA